jgi:hypothetical protein
MNKSKIKEIIREIVDRVLAENAPAPSKPKPSPGPAVAPNEPGEKEPERRRRDLRPDKDKNPIPKHMPAKAGLKEEEIINKIVARFKSKKGMDEMLSLGNLKPSDKKTTPRYTDAEINAMSVKQAADTFNSMWAVPHNADVLSKLKKKLRDAENAKNKK